IVFPNFTAAPNTVKRNNVIDEEDKDNFLSQYKALRHVLETAFNSSIIEGWWYDNEITLSVESTKKYLESKNLKSEFFNSNTVELPSYLDRNNPNHSSKLYFAIKAWEAVQEEQPSKPKQAVTKWLEENAGELSATAIAEIAKVVNWNTVGGAPRTPTND
ncbi:MAG: hypothetical protein U9N57_13680, partial [Pseudomonadota bacterium]|nr:hypothetical protein [Pseudomonadota bacterium]